MRRMLILFLFIPHLIFPALTVPGNPQQPAHPAACIAASWHYEPVEGKHVAIWPADGTCKEESYRIYRNKYGFTGAGIIQIHYSQDSPYQRAVNAGFDPKNIMIMTWGDSYIDAVKEIPAGIYYLDEPVEHDCSGHSTIGGQIYTPDELLKRKDYVHSTRPGSKYIIGGYKRCSHLQIAANCADNIMYTSYVNWDSWGIKVCHVNMGFGDDWEVPWSQGNSLQADSWNDMRSKFGAKFSMSWVNGRGDEYDKLFQTANSLGLEGIWLYAREGLGADSASTLEQFCQAAVANGWLKIVDDYIPAPMNVTAQKSEDGRSIVLSWLDISDNEKGFIIERKSSDSDFFARLHVAGPGTISFTDSTVEEGKVYSYRIEAFNDYNSSEYSNTSIISAPVVPHLSSPENNAKDQPLKLNFNWSPAPDAESYSIMISEDGLFSRTVFSDTLLSNPRAEINLLKDGLRYYWKVSSKDSSGIRSHSECHGFSTILLAPDSLKTETLSGRKVRLAWMDNSQSEDGYFLERKESSDTCFTLLTALDKNITTYTDSLPVNGTFSYRIRAFNQITYSAFSNEAGASVVTTVSKKEMIPIDYTLFQNHPNPYNPSTKISYTLPWQSRVRLLIYNSIGGIVKTLIDGVEDAGYHELYFNAEGLSSGIYFYSMEASATSGSANYRAARKMLLLK